MNRAREWMKRAAGLFHKERRDAELEEEIAAHLEMLVEQNVERGMAPEEARRAARIALGGGEQIKEAVREQRGLPWLESFIADVRFGMRMLRKNPGFTAIAILTLALGIGANTAIFSIVNAVLLRPLPFPNSDQLVELWESDGQRGATDPVSYPNFADWRAWNHSFSTMAAYTGGDYVLTGHGEPVHLEGVIASASLFQVLNIQPLLGRPFRPDEDFPHADNGADAIILSYPAWTEIFHRDPKMIGELITLDRERFLVVGIAPPGAESLLGDGQSQFWATAAPLAHPLHQSPKPLTEERQISFLHVIARLRPGVALPHAQADMDHVAAELEHAFPDDDSKQGVTIKGLQEAMTGNVRPLLLVLLTAVGIVLLIACANVAALILARGSSRGREMAIRRALGASKGRIAAQLMVECMLLSVIGAAAGLWLAIEAKDSLIKVLGVSWLANAPLDGRALGFALLLTAASCLIFGFAPSFRAAKTDVIEALKEGGHAAGESHRLYRLREALVTGQVALAVALLSVAGLLAHSLLNLATTNPGFDPTQVLTFPVSLPGQQYPQARWSSFFGELTARLRGIPGVLSVGATGSLPLANGENRTVIDNVAGRLIPLNKRRGIAFVPIVAGYFEALRIPIKAGRAFSDRDTPASQAVVILNETAARQYFGNGDAVGQQIEPLMWDGTGSKTQMRTIIGVTGDAKYRSLAQSADPTIYWPLAQIPSSSRMYLTVRTATNPMGIISAARAQLHAMDESLPMSEVWPLGHYFDRMLLQPRYNTFLMSTFALLALVLTAVGIYGSIAYTVALRTHEIGIRMAVGAQRRDVLRLVLGRGLKSALIGSVIGIAAAAAASRFLSSLLYGVRAVDPLTLISVSVVLTAVAIGACYVPAQRAMRVDPMVSLRHE